MRTLDIIIALCWIGLWLYWIASAFGAKRGSLPANKRHFFGIRAGILVLAVVLAQAYKWLPQSFKSQALGNNGFVLALGFAIFLSGLTIAIWARMTLGKNWGMPMTRKLDIELITDGPYRYIRHPIYSGILFMALGSAVVVNGYWLLILIVAAVLFIYSAVSEEKDMAAQFPKTYQRYKSHTKMLIPYIF